jgi:hypothetical protein
VTQPATARPDAAHDADFVIIETADSAWAWSCHKGRAAAVARLVELRTEKPEQFRNAQVALLDDFVAAREASFLDQPVVEITADDWDYQFNCLPPLHWTRTDGVERFLSSEFTSGRITRQFARRGERHFMAYARAGDSSTFLTAPRIGAAFPEEAARTQ